MDAQYNSELCAKMHEEINKDLGDLKRTSRDLIVSDAKHTADIQNLADSLKTFKVAAWGLFASGVLMLLGQFIK